MNNKLIYFSITLFVIGLHITILLLFVQANESTWVKQASKTSSAIHIQLLSTKKGNSPKPIKKAKLDTRKITNNKKINKKISESKPEKKLATLTNNDNIKEEMITKKNDKKQIYENKNKPITSDNKTKTTTETVKNLENNNAKKNVENQNKPQIIENNYVPNNFDNHQSMTVYEEYENEGENEDNEELAGFETIYRNQYNEKTININNENINNKLTETPVFDDILYVSESKAKQHLIEPSAPQLPLEIINNISNINKNNPEDSWQVVVTLYVDKHGNVLNQPKPFIKPLQSSGNQLIDENALQYATSLRFQPFIKNDKAVIAEVELVVRY